MAPPQSHHDDVSEREDLQEEERRPPSSNFGRDTTPGSSGYTGLWLFKNNATGTASWSYTTDAALRSQNATLLFPSSRAFFFKPAVGARGEWIVPAP